jgi:hypothetical protein
VNPRDGCICLVQIFILSLFDHRSPCLPGVWSADGSAKRKANALKGRQVEVGVDAAGCGRDLLSLSGVRC